MTQQPPDPTGPSGGESPVRRGIGIAREALAAARAEARRRGQGAASRGSGQVAGGGAWSNGWRSRRAPADRRSGAHPDERDPQLLTAAVDRLLADRGWETDAAVGGAMGRWGAIVGPELAAHCEPLSFERGKLVVQADSTAWATQLRLLAPVLLRRLNEDLGAGTVSSVKVLGPGSPSWKRGRLSVRGRGPRDTYG